MKKLVKYNEYSRKDIHDIFSPNTKFTPGSGYWGISGIIKVPNTRHDYIFLVTYGQKQVDHKFKEGIDEYGILTWQSQVSQNLKTPQILEFIKHDYTTDNIYLFLRKDKKSDYKYMGLLAYVDHDNQRENPVYFKWQILDWNNQNKEINSGDENVVYGTNTEKKNFDIKLSDESYEHYTTTQRKGKNTIDFYSNKNINFEGEVKKNTELGNKGEDVVVEFEKLYLISRGREDLADKVITTRKIAGNAERFDILSYDENGNEKYIEVKTTTGGINNAFHISEREVKFSHMYPEKYYLYRLFNFDIKTMSSDLKIVKGPINRDLLEPTNYICRICGK